MDRLTPAEAERLAMLAEEAGEIVQMVGKVLRHGWNSRHPDGGPVNRELLAREVSDLDAVKQLMFNAGDWTMDDGTELQTRALSGDIQRKLRYCHHQEPV